MEIEMMLQRRQMDCRVRISRKHKAARSRADRAIGGLPGNLIFQDTLKSLWNES